MESSRRSTSFAGGVLASIHRTFEFDRSSKQQQEDGSAAAIRVEA